MDPLRLSILQKLEILTSQNLNTLRRGRFPPRRNCQPLLNDLKAMPKIDHHIHLTCAISPKFLTSQPLQHELKQELRKQQKKHAITRQEYLTQWSRDNHVGSLESFQAAVQNAVNTILEQENIVGFGLRLNPIKFLTSYDQEGLESAVQKVFEAGANAILSSRAQEKNAQVSMVASFNRTKKYGIRDLSDQEAVIFAMEKIHSLEQNGLLGGIDISGPEYTVREQSPRIWKNVLERVLNLGWKKGFLVTVHLGDPSNLEGELKALNNNNSFKYLLEHYKYFSNFLDVISCLAINYPFYQFRIGHGYLLTPFDLLAPKNMQGNKLPKDLDEQRCEILQKIVRNRIAMEVCPSVTARRSNWKTGRLEVKRYRNLPIFDWLTNEVKIVLGTDSLFTRTSATLSENILRLMLACPKMAEKIMEIITINPTMPTY